VQWQKYNPRPIKNMFSACILWGSNPRALECAADLKPAPLDHSGKNAWMGALKKLSSLFLVDFGKNGKRHVRSGIRTHANQDQYLKLAP
jgi:hypothetical protein